MKVRSVVLALAAPPWLTLGAVAVARLVPAPPASVPAQAAPMAVADRATRDAWAIEARVFACRERLAAQRCRTVACLRTQTAVLQADPWPRLRELKDDRIGQWKAGADSLRVCLLALGMPDESERELER